MEEKDPVRQGKQSPKSFCSFVSSYNTGLPIRVAVHGWIERHTYPQCERDNGDETHQALLITTRWYTCRGREGGGGGSKHTRFLDSTVETNQYFDRVQIDLISNERQSALNTLYFSERISERLNWRMDGWALSSVIFCLWVTPVGIDGNQVAWIVVILAN
jgi:hypothetical protein